MAKRLRMTGADYVAIAISPALIMALVGSLIFFLIEVLYVGQYQARLNYVFALFVFATVLIGRISIEFGAERAAMYGAPLGIAVFLVLSKFVEHPSPYSSMINLALIGIVWWSAHKLTWDCTLIDDNVDASGEGLMQRIGLDEMPEEPLENEVVGNELFDSEQNEKRRPHAPGLWVLYFSMAALPLFGVGQRWIPAADIGRRRYVFALLTLYVAAGLTLLVTTSFLGLRRYLRQRRVEMSAPMATTWVATGTALIAIVMSLAALLPRPHAEYAISQVPWQIGSPDGLRSSRRSVGNNPSDEQPDDQDDNARRVTTEAHDPESTVSREGDRPDVATDEGEQQVSTSEGETSDDGQSSDNKTQSRSESESDNRQNESSGGKSQTQPTNQDASSAKGDLQESIDQEESLRKAIANEQRQDTKTHNARSSSNATSRRPKPSLPNVLSVVGGMLGVLKIVFYLIVAAILIYLGWTHRKNIAMAVADLLKQFRELLARLAGRKTFKYVDSNPPDAARHGPVPPPFASFRDPFSSGGQQLSPNEIVQTTFEAFEAWAREQGYPRRPEQTPDELLRESVDAQLPLYAEARRLVQLYNMVAYSRSSVSTDDVAPLANVWKFMRHTNKTILPSDASLPQPNTAPENK